MQPMGMNEIHMIAGDLKPTPAATTKPSTAARL